MVVILGAGLAGLSAAYHLSDRDYVLIERESEVGGLCRSQRHDGFVFDFTGLAARGAPRMPAWIQCSHVTPDG